MLNVTHYTTNMNTHTPPGRPTRLVPLPIRITPQQRAMLEALRDATGLTIQDHVRRALDFYLSTRGPMPTEGVRDHTQDTQEDMFQTTGT